MKYKSVYTAERELSKAVRDLQNQLQDINSKLIIYFSTAAHDGQLLAGKMKKAFPDVETFGSTTAGEITTGKMLEGSVVAMAFSGEVIDDLYISVIENISDDNDAVAKAVDKQRAYFGKALNELDYKDYVGLLLIDGLSGAEEKVIEKIGDFTNIKVVGGSAGDDLKFERTQVFHDDLAISNGAVFCIMKPKVAFDIIKTQSFKPTEIKLTVTKTNEQKREVLEFNNQPAAKIYADALQTSVADLPKKAFKNPLGMMVTVDEPFVRSPRVVENDSVFFYCSVKEGMELNVLEPTDIIKDTAKAIEEKKAQLGGISAIVNFHCILRTLDLKGQDRMEEYGSIFNDIPTIGFSTYGECYLGHINQTSTMLVFK